MTIHQDATTDAISTADIDGLRAAVLGDVVAPGDPAYDHARRVWNGVIDRHPALIVGCAGVSDVAEAVRFARRHPIPLSIRGGGHQVAGSAVCDDGLVIDLSAMNGVHVDAHARTARVQAGAQWAHVDRATQLFGLATPAGVVSATGVAGLTLGGGMGLTQRAFGLACDNLRSIEIVTADGMVRTASAQQHPDLFWAARGAGRGLGVVTSFEFDLHPLGPDVTVAQVVYAIEDAKQCLAAFRDLAVDAPDAISPQVALWTIPAIARIPGRTSRCGRRRACSISPPLRPATPPDAQSVLDPFQRLATPIADLTVTAPYAALQSAFLDFFFPKVKIATTFEVALRRTASTTTPSQPSSTCSQPSARTRILYQRHPDPGRDAIARVGADARAPLPAPPRYCSSTASAHRLCVVEVCR